MYKKVGRDFLQAAGDSCGEVPECSLYFRMASRWMLPPWILFLLFTGCSPGGRESRPLLRYETRTLSRAFGSCDSAGMPCVSVRFSYPAIAGGESSPGVDSVAAYVNREMFASLEDAERTLSFDSIASDLTRQYTDLREEFSDYHLPWTLERLCTVLMDTGGVVSIRFEESSFLGGAHGLRIVRLASFDASSGRRLTYADLFQAGSDSAFARIAEREFRAVRGIPDSQSLSDAGFWIEEGKLEPPLNAAVGIEELILYYNVYEIAPYVLGPTEVHIPLVSLKSIIRRHGPLDF